MSKPREAKIPPSVTYLCCAILMPLGVHTCGKPATSHPYWGDVPVPFCDEHAAASQRK